MNSPATTWDAPALTVMPAVTLTWPFDKLDWEKSRSLPKTRTMNIFGQISSLITDYAAIREVLLGQRERQDYPFQQQSMLGRMQAHHDTKPRCKKGRASHAVFRTLKPLCCNATIVNPKDLPAFR